MKIVISVQSIKDRIEKLTRAQVELDRENPQSENKLSDWVKTD